jgi:hypothetical protein
MPDLPPPDGFVYADKADFDLLETLERRVSLHEPLCSYGFRIVGKNRVWSGANFKVAAKNDEAGYWYGYVTDGNYSKHYFWGKLGGPPTRGGRPFGEALDRYTAFELLLQYS